MRDPGHRGLIIPYPVSMPMQGEQRHLGERFRDELGIAQDAPVILFLGRVTAQKGVLELLEAFDLLWQRRHDAILVLIGPPDGQYGAAVAERIGHLSSRPNIHLLGPAYGEKKSSAWATASLFVTLSQNEGLPNAVLEAMAWGLPVVITPQANLPDVAGYNAGAVVAANPGNVADALERLLEDPTQLKQMGRNARRLVEERFTSEKVLPQMLALYERIVHNRR
ncbi:MAG TPA: glycosyltransferase family 4 protein [Candidatus Tectomicrobia bacterium]|nr:glycosyltransferase family 4 protein [Candidatus Tectomicrobia bacterium]